MSEFSNHLSIVTTTEHFLVREHFDEVEVLAGSVHAKSFVGQTYAVIAEPKELGRVRRQRFPHSISPEQIGLIVAKREEVGFPPQSGPPFNTADELAIQAGSFLNFVDSINDESFSRLSGFGPQRIEFVNQAAGLVRLLIQQAANTK